MLVTTKGGAPVCRNETPVVMGPGVRRDGVDSLDLPCLFRQHDGNAVADRVGEFGGARDQFLPRAVEFQRPLGQRTDEDFQKLWIDGTVGAFGRGIHTRVSGAAWAKAKRVFAHPTA